MPFHAPSRNRSVCRLGLPLLLLILSLMVQGASAAELTVTSRVDGQGQVASDPTEPAPYIAYAEFLMANRDFRGAQDVLEVGRNKAAPSADLLVTLGEAYEAQDRLARAESVTREALVIDPQHVDAHIRMGEIYFRLGWPKSGLESFRTACELAPEATLPKVRVVGGLIEQNNLVEAEDACLEFIAGDSENTDLWLALGQVFEKQSKLHEAFTTYGQVLTLDPDLAEAYARQGRLFCRFGQYDAGRTACAKALELDEDNVLAHAYMGIACGSLGDGENARLHAQIAEAGGMNMTSVWRMLNQ